MKSGTIFKSPFLHFQFNALCYEYCLTDVSSLQLGRMNVIIKLNINHTHHAFIKCCQVEGFLSGLKDLFRQFGA